MGKKLSRAEAIGILDDVMADLYQISLNVISEELKPEQSEFVRNLRGLLQVRHEADYKAALKTLSLKDFTEYYNLVIGLGVKMNLQSAVRLSSYTLAGDESAEKNNSPYWKIYLNKENKVSRVEYGSDRSQVEIIDSDGIIQRREVLADRGGFAGLLAGAVGKTENGNMIISAQKMEEIMLDSGLYYLKERNSWIRKEDYFNEKISKEYAALEHKADVELSAEYADSKNKLTFYYQEKGQSKKLLFEVDAGNRQRSDRTFPTKDNDEIFAENKVLYTLPPEGGKGEPYIPGKFPAGSWEIYGIQDNNTKEYGPYKILTTAWRLVDVWEIHTIKNENDKDKWRIKKDSDGNVVQAKDGCLWIHGGRGSTATSELDAVRGTNNHLDTTHGCIRIKNIDAELIVKTIRDYLKTKHIPLEVK